MGSACCAWKHLWHRYIILWQDWGSSTCALASNRPRLVKAAGSADWLWCAALRQKLWNLAPQILAMCLTTVSLGLTQREWHFQPHVPTGLNVASFVVGLACRVLLYWSAPGIGFSCLCDPWARARISHMDCPWEKVVWNLWKLEQGYVSIHMEVQDMHAPCLQSFWDHSRSVFSTSEMYCKGSKGQRTDCFPASDTVHCSQVKGWYSYYVLFQTNLPILMAEIWHFLRRLVHMCLYNAEC